jgi:hypothetical protein
MGQQKVQGSTGRGWPSAVHGGGGSQNRLQVWQLAALVRQMHRQQQGGVARQVGRVLALLGKRRV